jgi:hypothetical protein
MADQASKPVKMNGFMNDRELECALLKSDGAYFMSRGISVGESSLPDTPISRS